MHSVSQVSNRYTPVCLLSHILAIHMSGSNSNTSLVSGRDPAVERLVEAGILVPRSNGWFRVENAGDVPRDVFEQVEAVKDGRIRFRSPSE